MDQRQLQALWTACRQSSLLSATSQTLVFRFWVLDKHRTELSSEPFAAFLVCMKMTLKNETYRHGVKEWLHPVRNLVRPLSEGYFAGSLHISNIPLLGDRLTFRISVVLGVWTEGDHRDWNAIRAWAGSFVEIFQPERAGSDPGLPLGNGQLLQIIDDGRV